MSYAMHLLTEISDEKISTENVKCSKCPQIKQIAKNHPYIFQMALLMWEF
jgi:ribosomal protein S27AE